MSRSDTLSLLELPWNDDARSHHDGRRLVLPLRGIARGVAWAALQLLGSQADGDVFLAALPPPRPALIVTR